MFPQCNRQLMLAFVILAGLVVAARADRQAGAQQPDRSASEHEIVAAAERIHAEAVTIDTHVDIAGADYATEKLDPGIDNPKLKCDLVKMTRGGVDGVFLAVYVPQGKRDAEGYAAAFASATAKSEAIHRLAESMYPKRCELAMSPDDVERIAQTGRRALMIGVENGYPIGADLANVEKLYDLGARYITLSHNGHNQICDSCSPSSRLGDEKHEHNGLSPFGREVVAEMNRLGMMIDVSHISSESFWDVIEASRAPVIASHSGCRALNDHPRNLDDRQLEALANSGGVIQVVALGAFLNPRWMQRYRARMKLVNKIGIPRGPRGPEYGKATLEQLKSLQEGMEDLTRQFPPANVKDYVDHIEHAVNVAGVDHVGIGTDFDGGGGLADFHDHSQAKNVTVELLRRGFSEEAIKKIWGGNLLRVWRDVERVAAHLR